MRFRRPSLRRFFLLLLAFAAAPALAQNLLVNPGFDRDLGGWTPRTDFGFGAPSGGEATVAWDAQDAAGNAASGSVALHAKPGSGSTTAAAGQCVAIPGQQVLVTFGARFLTRSERLSVVTATLRFFAAPGCSGAALSDVRAPSLPSSVTTGSNSGGAWVSAGSEALSPPGSASVLLELSATGLWTWFYGIGWADVVADDAFLALTPTTTTTWILPSAAWVHGAAGSYWTTQFTLCNPGPNDAAVTLKWLGHDADGRGGYESTYVVSAGQTLVPDEETWEINHPEDWGAILVTSSSPALFMQSETSTFLSGGTVGQAVPALGPADFATSTPKTLAPIREDSSFRTNLVLANATSAPLTAHVALYAADGTLLGARDVDLPPLGMTQINRVASALGTTILDTGRIAVSTPTPGGLVAAYASVIDNTTNDPRTILPQDGTAAAQAPAGANLLVNPGFDRDLSGWTWTPSLYPSFASASADWVPSDASGNSLSGGVRLQAGATVGSGKAAMTQCAPVAGPSLVRFGAKFFMTRQDSIASAFATVSFFRSTDCSGPSLGEAAAGAARAPRQWVSAASQAVSSEGASSVRLEVAVQATATIDFGQSVVDGIADDALLTAAPAGLTTSLLPSAALIFGPVGISWQTGLTLVNAGASEAVSTLVFLPHDASSASGAQQSVVVPAGQIQGLDDQLIMGGAGGWGAILVTSSSPALYLQSETSTSLPSGGTVGQALPAFDARYFADAVPKTLAPIRENASFRTNLVLANATEIPVTAHVALFAADGTPIGARDVALSPLGMTQINRVAAALGAAPLDLGRISVSTPTPGGLVAAYASVIDNVTNDPRTILPR